MCNPLPENWTVSLCWWSFRFLSGHRITSCKAMMASLLMQTRLLDLFKLLLPASTRCITSCVSRFYFLDKGQREPKCLKSPWSPKCASLLVHPVEWASPCKQIYALSLILKCCFLNFLKIQFREEGQRVWFVTQIFKKIIILSQSLCDRICIFHSGLVQT